MHSSNTWLNLGCSFGKFNSRMPHAWCTVVSPERRHATFATYVPTTCWLNHVRVQVTLAGDEFLRELLFGDRALSRAVVRHESHHARGSTITVQLPCNSAKLTLPSFHGSLLVGLRPCLVLEPCSSCPYHRGYSSGGTNMCIDESAQVVCRSVQRSTPGSLTRR